MKQIDIEFGGIGQRQLTEDEIETIKKLVILVESMKDRPIVRLRLRKWVFKITYTVRLKLFVPFLRWLLDAATDFEYAAPEEEAPAE